MLERYRNESVGLNNRMTEIAAVIGLEQLKRIDRLNSKRIQNAGFLTKNLLGTPGVQVPAVREDSRHVFHQYTLIIEGDRDAFANDLRAAGVETGIYYPFPVHKLAPFSCDAVLPVTDYLTQHCLSLPIHPSLTSRQLSTIADAVRIVGGA
jgi:dTDP-4-amino-4,6-dideoxygalactose transaminase